MRSSGVIRSIGTVTETGDRPQPTPAAGERFVALDRMRAQIERLEWAPLQLTSAARGRPPSPRVPQALLLHLAHAARLASASDAAVAGLSIAEIAVAVDTSALAGFLGADDESVAAALRALLHADALQAGPDTAREARPTTRRPSSLDAHPGLSVGTSAPDVLRRTLPGTVTLAPTLLGPPPRCAALDWSGLALATAGAPSAWVAAHVLAERLVLDEWTPMPRSALEHTLGCGVSGVRSALERLTVAGAVERREQRGGVSAYRFSAELRAAAGQGGGVPRVSPPSPPRLAAPAAPRAVTASSMPLAAPATGVRLSVGGVELDVPAGLRVRVEIGADGMPQITLVPAATPTG